MMQVSEYLVDAWSEKDFDAAASACRQAREVLESKRDVYTDQEYRDKLAKVEDQAAYIDQQRAKWGQLSAADRIREIDEAKAKREREIHEFRRQDIERLTREAKGLIRQKQYGQAVETMDRIRALDPNNAWIEENEDVYKELNLLRDRRELNVKYQENVQRQHNVEGELEVPWWQALTYPDDWRELTARREKYGVTAATASEADRANLAKLQQRIPKLDFDDTEFSSVIQFLREISGLNIAPNYLALDAAGLGGGNSKTAKVSVHLADVTVEQALTLILSNLGGGATELSFKVDEVGVTISTKEDISKDAFDRVYDISDLLARGPMLRGPVLDLAQSANPSSQPSDAKEEATKAEMLRAITEAIKSSVESGSWKQDGTTASLSQFSGGLIVHATPEQQTVIAGTIERLRKVRGPQVEVAGSIAMQKATGKIGAYSRDNYKVNVDTLHPGGQATDIIDRTQAVPMSAPDAGIVIIRNGGSAAVSLGDKQLSDFINRNYQWTLTRTGTGQHPQAGGWFYTPQSKSDEGSVPAAQLDEIRGVLRKLGDNLGQKVTVNSRNVALSARVAQQLGAKFSRKNGLAWSVIDEAQFRSLIELDAGAAGANAGSSRRQETIVGTGALLSNGMVCNVAFAGEGGNRFTLGANQLDLAHEDYLLIDNGETLTLVGASGMQYWTEAPPAAPEAEAPQVIEAPRVGQLARFERTLLEPTDDMVIHLDYVLKGTGK
jgi:hypothetical protein